MLIRIRFCFWLASLAAATAAAADGAPSILPGQGPDGSTRLHNQRLIRPAGAQMALGDFPVNLAVDPSGRFAAVLHAGYGRHEVRIIDFRARRMTDQAALPETFYGLAFSSDGRTLVCSGGSTALLRVFDFDSGKLRARATMGPKDDRGLTSGLAWSPDGRDLVAARLYENQVERVDLASGRIRWTARLGQALSEAPDPPRRPIDPATADNDILGGRTLLGGGDPLALAWDRGRGRIYASLWGESCVAVLDAAGGRILSRWPCGLHPNELALSPRGLLYVANGGANTVTVLDTGDGRTVETLSAAMAADDLPGSTPDSMALAPDGRTLFVANACNDNVAVFDVSRPGSGRPLGFIPTGWFPTSVRLTPDGRTLLVVSARGVSPLANSTGSPADFLHIDRLYRGSLGAIDLPRGPAFDAALAGWTRAARLCRPVEPVRPARGNPIPERPGGASPIRYVIYVIKENRTYDQVLGDLPKGNGDPALCLFPRKVSPNHHALAEGFVLLDNFYASAEVSAGGHEWSMAGYASEFVEKIWPVSYGHKKSNALYPSEGHFAAALPPLGYLWDRAAQAGLTYRSYGEFVVKPRVPGGEVTVNLPGLAGHFDPGYAGFDTSYPDRLRMDRYLAEFRAFEAAGEMPRLQIVRLPSDHTAAAKLGEWSPRAMVADNDLALGRLVDAVSHSRFWPRTAIFVVEDDAQNGPDHVDAHRTVALVASPYARRGAVDSTPYTTCSMLRTMELILGLGPLSQFDATAQPMWASFQERPDPEPYLVRPAGVDLGERNVRATAAARASANFDLSREDAVDDREFNRAVWAAERGPESPMPAPVHAAFVRDLGPDRDEDD